MEWIAMTDNERLLLVLVANWIAGEEEKAAAELNTTSNLADELRRLIEVTRSERQAAPPP